MDSGWIPAGYQLEIAGLPCRERKRFPVHRAGPSVDLAELPGRVSRATGPGVISLCPGGYKLPEWVYIIPKGGTMKKQNMKTVQVRIPKRLHQILKAESARRGMLLYRLIAEKCAPGVKLEDEPAGGPPVLGE